MVRDPGKHPPPSPEALFSATQAPVPSSRLFWLRLLSHRPLVLLGSLWLVTVCLAAVASHRLLFADPGKETNPPTSQSSALSSKDSSTSSSPLGASNNAEPSGDGTAVRSHHRTQVTLWGLGSLVGLCALGSVVISQRAKAAARRPPQRRVRRVKPKAKTKTATGPKRLQPYSPQRDAVIVKGAQAVQDTLPLTMVEAEAEATTQNRPAIRGQTRPPTVPKPAGAKVNLETAAMPSMGAQAVESQADHLVPQPEVVPPDEAHPLDWEEDSLAHTLDLRQRRSLSSLM